MATSSELLLATLAQVVKELDATVETGPGAFRSLVLSPATRLAQYTESRLTETLDRYDLSLLSNETDPAILDEIALRYGITRSNAAFAYGTLTLILDAEFPLVIPAGTLFQGPSGTYITSRAFALRLSPVSVIAGNDRLLVARGDGTFVASIEVSAVQAGSIYNLAQGESVSLISTLDHVIGAFAASDFIGGQDAESGISLLTRIQDSLTRPGTDSAYGIAALIRSPGAFPTVQSVSVVGAGDTEMRRDKVNALGIGGGMADVYVRPRAGTSTVSITKVGVSKGTSLGRRTWEIAINRNDFPGWWDIPEVRDTQGNVLTVESDVRGIDLTGEPGQITPYIPETVHGTYSMYQTALITVTTVEDYTSGIFTVALRGMPEVAEIQRLLGGRDYRTTGGDILVKLAVPCYVTASISLTPLTNEAAIPTDEELTQRLVNFINSTGFTGTLYASQIADALSGANYTVDNVKLSGEILLPNGTRQNQISESFLRIPTVAEHQLSWRTTVFVANTNRVSITRQTPVNELIR